MESTSRSTTKFAWLRDQLTPSKIAPIFKGETIEIDAKLNEPFPWTVDVDQAMNLADAERAAAAFFLANCTTWSGPADRY